MGEDGDRFGPPPRAREGSRTRPLTVTLLRHSVCENSGSQDDCSGPTRRQVPDPLVGGCQRKRMLRAAGSRQGGDMNIKAYGPILMVGFFAGLIGGIASGSRPSLAQQIPPTIQAQTIQAQNIEVLDRSGKLRMRLASNPQTGAAGVSIFDASNGTARIIIGALVDGTSDIQIMDANGNRRASLDF